MKKQDEKVVVKKEKLGVVGGKAKSVIENFDGEDKVKTTYPDGTVQYTSL